MNVDVVIVTKTASPEFRRMTEECLISLLNSEPLGCCRPFVVETHPGVPDYPGVTMVRPAPEPLNYNRYLNAGAACGINPLIAFCNNDLLFQLGWWQSCQQVFEQHPELATLGTKSPGYGPQNQFLTGLHQGWRTCYEFSGWCFLMRRSVWQQLNGLSEQFQFWGSDCMTVLQLQRAGYTHFLNADAHVIHRYSQSHRLLSPEELERVTNGELAGILAERRRREFQLPPILPHSPMGVAGVPS